MSDDTVRAIDHEVRKIIDECYEKARQILEEHRDKLDMMADALMDFETIDADQIADIMAGKPPKPPADWTAGDKAKKPDDTDSAASEDAAGPIGDPAGEH